MFLSGMRRRSGQGSNRDGSADPMLEFFDFMNPPFVTPPALPDAVIDPDQLAACS